MNPADLTSSWDHEGMWATIAWFGSSAVLAVIADRLLAWWLG